jgi:hypothetical protein
MQLLKRGDLTEIETMEKLIWFTDNGFTFGVCPDTPPRVIADVLSAGFPIPLETDAILSEDFLIAGSHKFCRVEEPRHPYRHLQIYLGAACPSGIPELY